jgi:hypothetical protein
LDFAIYTKKFTGPRAMTIQGRDCLIVIKTAYREAGLPYSEETIREAVSLLTEEAPD